LGHSVRISTAISLPLALLLSALAAGAQEMEPGAYSRAPVGTNIVLVTYGYQTGDVLTDASLPLRDVNTEINSAVFTYSRTFALFGRQANIGGAIPYVFGTVQGTVFEESQLVRRSGLADARIRFSANLIGSPALQPREFAVAKRKTVVGVGLTVVVPTGQYDPARLINPGTNRWAFKPEIGISKPAGRWTFEIAIGAWLFTENKNFFGGNRRAQDPLLSLQGHVIYTFRPRTWVSAGVTYYNGGGTIINDVANDDRVSNSRYGATFSYPINNRHSLKFAVSRGLTARYGGDLTSAVVGWQYTWF
jgi:hypothetical protein